MSARDRGRILNKAAELLRERMPELALIESLSTGRCIRQELDTGHSSLNFVSSLVVHLQRDERAAGEGPRMARVSLCSLSGLCTVNFRH